MYQHSENLNSFQLKRLAGPAHSTLHRPIAVRQSNNFPLIMELSKQLKKDNSAALKDGASQRESVGPSEDLLSSRFFRNCDKSPTFAQLPSMIEQPRAQQVERPALDNEEELRKRELFTSLGEVVYKFLQGPSKVV